LDNFIYLSPSPSPSSSDEFSLNTPVSDSTCCAFYLRFNGLSISTFSNTLNSSNVSLFFELFNLFYAFVNKLSLLLFIIVFFSNGGSAPFII
jgi:hypothetical protein